MIRSLWTNTSTASSVSVLSCGKLHWVGPIAGLKRSRLYLYELLFKGWEFYYPPTSSGQPM